MLGTLTAALALWGCASKSSGDAVASSGDAGTDAIDAHTISSEAGASSGDAGGAAAKALRITSLALRDPPFVFGGVDITDQPVLGQSVNGSLIPDGLNKDYDGDGFLDVSMLITLPSWGPQANGGQLGLIDALCALSDGHTCQPDPNAVLDARWPFDNRESGTCLKPVAGITTTFEGSGVMPAGPCFTTQQGRDVTIHVGGIRMPLSGAQLAAHYDGSDPHLTDGLLMGFVTQQDADDTLLPSYLPVLGNTPLSSYLRASDGDDGAGPNGESGYWIYFNFEAEEVDYGEP